MGEIVNLNRVRKRKARSEAHERAAENRSRHGRTKAAKDFEAAEGLRVERAIEGHRLEDESRS